MVSNNYDHNPSNSEICETNLARGRVYGAAMKEASVLIESYEQGIIRPVS
jgi:hypothetical protein